MNFSAIWLNCPVSWFSQNSNTESPAQTQASIKSFITTHIYWPLIKSKGWCEDWKYKEKTDFCPIENARSCVGHMSIIATVLHVALGVLYQQKAKEKNNRIDPVIRIISVPTFKYSLPKYQSIQTNNKCLLNCTYLCKEIFKY